MRHEDDALGGNFYSFSLSLFLHGPFLLSIPDIVESPAVVVFDPQKSVCERSGSL